ncbi:MAG TPA: ABC transporter substrate-binding protein, partial [Chloroflexota bacterium]|nr:ABC transporter substrate-binding protein [Chloroflexota bacterium]
MNREGGENPRLGHYGIIPRVKDSPPARPSRRALLARSAAFIALVTLSCGPQPVRVSGPPARLTLVSPTLAVDAAQTLFAQQANDAAREAGLALQYQTVSASSLRAQLRSTDAAGQFADVSIIASVDVPRLVARGLLREVRDTFERIAGVNGDLFPPLLDLASAGPWTDLPSYRKPPIWAIPHLSVGSAWLVRSDLLGKKTIPPPNTFDEFRSAADQLTDATAATYGWSASLPLEDSVDDLAQTVLLDHGAGIFESTGLRIAFSAADVEAGLKAFAGLYRADSGLSFAPPGSIDWSPADAAMAYSQGTVAQTVDLGGLYFRIVSLAPKLREQIQALPPPQGPKGRFTASPTSLLVVSRLSAVTDQAADFVERLLSPARYDSLVRTGSGALVPPYAYLTKSPFWDDDPNYATFAANARGDPARAFQFATPGSPAPLTLSVAEVRGRQILASILRSVVNGEVTPAAAAAA